MNTDSQPNDVHDLLDFLCSQSTTTLSHMAQAYDRRGMPEKAAELIHLAQKLDAVAQEVESNGDEFGARTFRDAA